MKMALQRQIFLVEYKAEHTADLAARTAQGKYHVVRVVPHDRNCDVPREQRPYYQNRESHGIAPMYVPIDADFVLGDGMEAVLELLRNDNTSLFTKLTNGMVLYPFDDRKEMRLPCMKSGRGGFQTIELDCVRQKVCAFDMVCLPLRGSILCEPFFAL